MAKIILADDDPFMIQIYSTRLSKDGHQIISCTDGQQAVDKAKEINPDLIVLDIMLPKLNGLDALSAIKADSRLKHIPVVILSNLSHPEEREEAQKRGAEEFLAKVQFTPSQVVAVLQKYLSGASSSGKATLANSEPNTENK